MKKLIFIFFGIILLICSVAYALNINEIQSATTRPACVTVTAKAMSASTINVPAYLNSLVIPALTIPGQGNSQTHYYKMTIDVNFSEISQIEYNAMPTTPTVIQY